MPLNEELVDQWSTVRRLISGSDGPAWVSDEDRIRLAAYTKYEQMYWSDDRAFQLMRRGAELEPVLVPNPRTIVDSTAHYLLKDLKISFSGKAKRAWEQFQRKVHFASKFVVAKHSGVVRGDWVFHITVDEDAPEGERVKLISLDPSVYFPVYNPDDLDEIVAVHLAEQFRDDDDEWRIRKRIYTIVKVAGQTRISVKEEVYENPRFWRGKDKPMVNRVTQPEGLLPEEITHIPVYHFKNMDWQGQPFGSSELRGYERIASSINQTISDEELALALEGLGVYATDAGTPKDDNGNELPWEISPARVMEIPTGSTFKRVEGVGTVKPMLDHVNWLYDRVMESSGTFVASTVDVQVAQSGIALQIRFLPTQAKIGERDLEGQDVLYDMGLDWTDWWSAYEDADISGTEPTIELGEKLPINREERIGELNYMLDRNVISRKYYRSEMSRLFGFVFPDDIEDEVLEEMDKFESAKWNVTEQSPVLDADGNPVPTDPTGKVLPGGLPSNPSKPAVTPASQSNNRNGKVNESNGNEAGQSLKRQVRPANGRRS